MAALWYASLGVVLHVLLGCASANPKPIEVEMPGAHKHFIVRGAGDRTLR